MEKPAQNLFPLHDLIKNRWSPRSFASESVGLENLSSLFEAARWAPSGGNLQPWSFIIASAADQESQARFLDVLSEGNVRWARQAPILVLTVAKMDRAEGKANPWALYDLGQSVATLSFQASALGISVHQMGGFDRQKAQVLFSIPSGYEPVTVLAIGYQGSLEDLPEDLRSRETEMRSRKAQADFVFYGEWNQPLREVVQEVLI